MKENTNPSALAGGKLWTGRFSRRLNDAANDFNSSIRIDGRMYREDITGSIAHAKMLAATQIIAAEDGEAIVNGLTEILGELDDGSLEIDLSYEDIHSFVEAELTKRLGDAGKRLHTARSRNDQVALDFRMYLMKRLGEISDGAKKLIAVIAKKASQYTSAIMPGYTHLQRAQPVSFAHHLLAYAFMLERDIGRLQDAAKRMNVLPLGSCALAGTTYDTDRGFVCRELGFDKVCENSIDGVSDRDFALEAAAALAIVATHLSRFSEEIILWCSKEFGFIELDDSFSTGSSIMPQKKNPDIAELVRGKSGRVYGDLIALLTMLKGLPLAYNKDMQEDKEIVFDAVDTVSACLNVFAPMLESAKVNTEAMRAAAAEGFINATDCADYLVKRGVPFRSAYKTTGEIVVYCIANKKTLETMTLDEYKGFDSEFDADIYMAINLEECLKKRSSEGGASPDSVKKQLLLLKERFPEIEL